MFGHRPAAHVASVIQTDADDLAGLAGMKQGDIGKIQGGYGFSVAAEEVAADLADGFAFQNAVTGGRAGTIANEVGHAGYCSAATMTGVVVGAPTPAASSRVTATAAAALTSKAPSWMCMAVPSLLAWNIPAATGALPPLGITHIS